MRFFALGCFVVAALAVANVRRGRSGRRLLAVRTNERAAAALGINVPAAKLYAFALASSIAALGGIVLAFRARRSTTRACSRTSPPSPPSAFAFIGGIGFLMGPVIGATLAPGAMGTEITNTLFSADATNWVTFAGGVLLILLVLQNQDGIAREMVSQLRWVRSRLPSLPASRCHGRPRPGSCRRSAETVQPRPLEVRDVTVRYGAVVAVDDVSLSVQPGPGRRPDRAERRRQDHTDRRGDGLHAARERQHPARRCLDRPPGRRLAGLAPASAGRSSRSSCSRTRRCSTTSAPQSDPRDWPPYPARHRLSDHAAATGGGGRGDQASSSSSTTSTASLRTYPTEGAGCWRSPVRLRSSRACCSSTSPLRASATWRRESSRTSSAVSADDWGMAILVVEHDMSFVMSVCDHIVVLDFGRKISEGPPGARPQRPGGDRGVPRVRRRTSPGSGKAMVAGEEK